MRPEPKSHYRAPLCQCDIVRVTAPRLSGVRRQRFMFSRIAPLWFLTAALFGAGVFFGMTPAESPLSGATSIEVLTPQSMGVGEPLPSQGLSTRVVAGADRDIRAGRLPVGSTPSHRQRLRSGSLSIDSCRERMGDDTRLTRAGLDNSSLGTPPPHA